MANNYSWRKTGIFFLCILIWQLVKCFSGYSNLYVYDIQERIRELVQNNSAVLIDSREFLRLRYQDNDYCFEYDSGNGGLQKEIESFRYWNESIYYVCKTTNSKELEVPKGYYLVSKDLCFNTSRKNNKHINIFQINKTDLTQNDGKYKDNQIYNGDIEQIASHSEKVQKFEKWITAGASFYSKDSFPIPVHSVLLPFWSTDFGELAYPVVYADSGSPIEGKYSLRFISRKESQLFCLNMIKKHNGVFSFDIRNNGKNCFMAITMSYYQQDNSWINKRSLICYYIPLHDKKINHYDILLREEDFIGSKAIIEFLGNNIDCSIDNISFKNLE